MIFRSYEVYNSHVISQYNQSYKPITVIMGISIESYRQRIGCFINAAALKPKKLKIKKPNQRKLIILGLLFQIICTIFPLSCNSAQLNSQTTFKSSRAALHEPLYTGTKPSTSWTGISWSFSNGGNRLVHALNGNKRNLGYRYLAWNCGRGFLSENKLDDLKLSINRKQTTKKA